MQSDFVNREQVWARRWCGEDGSGFGRTEQRMWQRLSELEWSKNYWGSSFGSGGALVLLLNFHFAPEVGFCSSKTIFGCGYKGLQDTVNTPVMFGLRYHALCPGSPEVFLSPMEWSFFKSNISKIQSAGKAEELK